MKVKLKREDWVKSFRWFLTSMIIVLGSFCLFTSSEASDVKPTWIGVMSFGVVFVILSVWRSIRGKILLTSLILVVGNAFVAKYMPFYLFIYTDYFLDINFYILWAGLILVIGVPVISIAFNKFDE